MNGEYSVINTQSYTYQDETGRLINGYKVNFKLNTFNETHFVLVPSLNKDTVHKAIMVVLNDRKALATQ